MVNLTLYMDTLFAAGFHPISLSVENDDWETLVITLPEGEDVDAAKALLATVVPVETVSPEMRLQALESQLAITQQAFLEFMVLMGETHG